MGGGWLTPRPGRFTPGKDPVPILQEARWATEPVWTGAENLAPTGIRSPDRPARSESLYRLSYRGPLKYTEANSKERLNKCRGRISKHGLWHERELTWIQTREPIVPMDLKNPCLVTCPPPPPQPI